MAKERYEYSICISCKSFDIYEKDNGEYECRCDKGKKLIRPREKCSGYGKTWEIPRWYFEVSGFPEMKPLREVFNEVIK